ncbi:tRNA uridine-5-carboxymethylaminomethyl(34) synthesis GTPase MnmE [Rhizobium sp. KVB221]|uniref:tRNA modification GTPase MnmE n=1 Tax=Rhizobium setariae TaxID=2801340 RepID=A0A936YTJ7_9HYPH|nr:tRNA uridine-5-carboxymethylaminomethyl(34) synthesis GTPase MnmE [Rhizobium setariae]MBL0374149.1 tRNA uridine-5-carboxymethylaminomethyl(34) synthesis GTPase MnmE [Rhizobium setariae]
MQPASKTVFALSSGSLPAGVAVIRISGPKVREILAEFAGGVPEPRTAVLRWFRDRDGRSIDQGLVLFFSGPNSFTGEDCAELQMHGGRASVNAILAVLSGVEEVKFAEAGEFSRRAFENGKLDLVEIEGLADLISAETEMQRRLALEQSSGHLSALYQSWMNRLTRARALIEAELDFPDEEDVPGSVSDRVWKDVATIRGEISTHLQGHRAAEIVRDGFKVVIAGRPNAGKSSLLNALARRDVAIVTDIAGTTRDLISVDLDIGGYLVRMVDTAGLRQSADIVEQEGVRRALVSVEDADLVLLLRDCDDGEAFPRIETSGKVLKISAKIDRAPNNACLTDADLVLSASTGEGIDSLTKRIEQILSHSLDYTGNAVAVRRRQVDLLRDAISAMDNSLARDDSLIELRAEDLRQASHCLGKITGFVDVEDLLDVIFSEFCIGK